MLFENCLCFTLARASRRVSKAYREKLEDFGLTQQQFFLLIALYEQDCVSITALAEKVALDKSTLTGLLDRMVRDGLVERSAAAGDRRAFRIKLSTRAEALRPKLTAIYEQTNSWLLSRLTEEERAGFERAISALEAATPDDDAGAGGVPVPGRKGIMVCTS
ncbi:MarR family winged helix-turn-helix transcriptional regulator [Geobacter grbiciae]|uniref:MarR family winged helix-turn-helix transcriptional regulator n=1 Tax=Geobacter grbiciae TaxID=155042 RepID=UPI001C011156|nr:MarR family transcriptional regulator [Geobacter grbiciae]MBT1076939.1 MarR family transcriptional regulator [Geobacter grbiciae]